MTSPSSDPQNNPLAGGIFMTLAMLVFTVNDTILKFIGKEVPVGQILWVRGGFTMAIIFAIAYFTGAWRHLHMIRTKPVFLRGVADLVTTYFFIHALLNMPLANATAILQVAPLTVMAFGAIFLGERLGWRRISAAIVGFIGVLLVVHPTSEGFNVYALLAIAAMFSLCARDVITRTIPATVPSSVITFNNALAVTLGGIVYSLFDENIALSSDQIGLLALMAVIIAAAYSLMVLTIRTADISSTAPFRYTVIIWSIVAGYIAFGEIPDTPALIGMSMIACTSIYALYRSRKVGEEL